MDVRPQILLVEDEEVIRMVVEDALFEGGYRTLVVASGAAALAEIEQDASRFRGLITDVRLGAGPSGWDVAHRAREVSPHIQVIYMTADSEHDWLSRGVPNSRILVKPFAPSQMVAAISGLLNDEDARQAGS